MVCGMHVRTDSRCSVTLKGSPRGSESDEGGVRGSLHGSLRNIHDNLIGQEWNDDITYEISWMKRLSRSRTRNGIICVHYTYNK
jgi:hypothetical protein